ncbi:nucleotidyltransferase family protein [Paenibacillus sp. 19GGS1-52]|uniref:nucleotidyltransferase family protein n=1 Tax=Paenibacillus sp. 19GGS1-52 TaxID=2758563 RepID=UPI001EFB1343|nr:nucleotidyltransferase family protein [Paenibacillus sp. 19GGS1-52]ULO07266.1 nucleotidyltransferase family protein [Paenibacillus sp. 19GGS1-52]
MQIHTEEDIIQLVKADPWMMEILAAAKSLQLPDWWVCAGFVRAKIWDVLHGFEQRTALPDVDVIYFDSTNLQEAEEKKLEARLRSINPAIPWSVKNEARMHVVNNLSPYTSAIDAISKFPETATALGLSLDEQDRILLTAPHGIQDVINLILRPTPHFIEHTELIPIYEMRLVSKNWKSIWTGLDISSNSQD